ncbi:MAG: oxygen-dependent coproporphyrinogen oxidase [Flavobacteriales bacterium]|nr:oxygen-dependent coproporphyrinogen oxidase [Flavobacteriales bacterium]|tara:strand:- start:920 stop:1840 length:921 start_codon:yes stop_codon:yes gene_type:complete
MNSPFAEEVKHFFMNLQDDICTAIQQKDGMAKFHEDAWAREGGGGGRTRVLQDGAIIDKGGVNWSAVYGELPKNIQKALNLSSDFFFASGVSIVMHPVNPHVPIIHMNIRYFETRKSKDSKEIQDAWFGGGIDLTPHYIVDEDAKWFHEQLKNVCDQHDGSYYSDHKKWADDYFFIKHRKETRGIGGIFFDRMKANSETSLIDLFNYVKGVGEAFAPIYTTLMSKNSSKPYGDQELEWQKIRRGRYVEFNLVYDKGTKFGLDTDGRIESILMSLPRMAGWPYDFQPEEGSKEADTLSKLVKGVNWV